MVSLNRNNIAVQLPKLAAKHDTYGPSILMRQTQKNKFMQQHELVKMQMINQLKWEIQAGLFAKNASWDSLMNHIAIYPSSSG